MKRKTESEPGSVMTPKTRERAQSQDVSTESRAPTAARTVRKLAKLAERPYVPSSDVPYEELRRLVRQHKAITKAAVAIDNMGSDRTNRETGETIACRLPEDVQLDLKETAKRQRGRANKLETAMLRELRKLPIWVEFLSKVMPSGVVVASYLVSEIDIRIATKPSQMRRFCGLAVIDGKLERRQKGQKNHYNQELRMRLWQWATAIYKCSFKGGVRVKSNKYLDRWVDWIHRRESADLMKGEQPEGTSKGWSKSSGWARAADLLICDLYVFWRTLEGLPVWPTYVEGVLRGAEHKTGNLVPNVPRLLRMDEMRDMIGEVSMRPLAQAAE
jgi:hypothetical protein